jgi:hypothetical protein
VPPERAAGRGGERHGGIVGPIARRTVPDRSLGPAQSPAIDELYGACDEPFASQSVMGRQSSGCAVQTEAWIMRTVDGGADGFAGEVLFWPMAGRRPRG